MTDNTLLFHLSDIHFGLEHNRALDWVAQEIALRKPAAVIITGDLTMHGVTRPVVLEVTGPSAAVKNPYGMTVMAASATGKLSRKDFGLTWNKTMDGGGLVVGDEVGLSFDVELIKKQAPAEAKR